jgi:hypothetical protein
MYYQFENDELMPTKDPLTTIHDKKHENIHVPQSSKKTGLSEYYNRYQKDNSVVISGSPITIKPRSDPIIPIFNYAKYYPDEEKGEPSTISELIKTGQPIHDPMANFFDDINGWDGNTEENVDIVNNDSFYEYLKFDDTNQPLFEDTPPIIKKRYKKKLQRKEEPMPLREVIEEMPKTPPKDKVYSGILDVPESEEKVEYKAFFSTKGLFQQPTTSKKNRYRGKLQSASSLPTKLESLKISTLVGERIHNQSRCKTSEIHPLPKPEPKPLPIINNEAELTQQWGMIKGNKFTSITNNSFTNSPKQLTPVNFRKGPKMLSAKGFRTMPVFSSDPEVLKLGREISNSNTLDTQEFFGLSGKNALLPHQQHSRLKSPRDFRNQVKTVRNKIG